MTKGSPGLEVRDVTVRVRSRTLLDGVSFEATPGEVVAIIGPNGAGKTTLLEVVTGIRRADGGTVAFRGAPLGRFSEKARCFAFLPDNGELPSELRVRDVIDHALQFRPRPSELVKELRQTLSLDSLSDAPLGVLSRGERQRVALFSALAVERPVIVLDEPFSAFDPLKLRDVLAAVRRVAESGATVLATVHHLGDATRIADRLLFLAEGRRIAWGDFASLQSAAGVPGGTLEDVFVTLLSRQDHGA
jgi:ABC-type multidrug transport system ATPase subunit